MSVCPPLVTLIVAPVGIRDRGIVTFTFPAEGDEEVRLTVSVVELKASPDMFVSAVTETVVPEALIALVLAVKETLLTVCRVEVR